MKRFKVYSLEKNFRGCVDLVIGQKVDISIKRLGSSGEGIGEIEGFTFFVEGALPTETVTIEISELKKNFGRGKLLKILTPSLDRVTPPCPVFETCGGCQIMHLKYEAQLESKQKKVQDALERIGKLKNVEVSPCIPSPLPFRYRNKIQLPVVKGTLGLYAKHSHNLVAIDTCLIHCELGEKVFQKVKELLAHLRDACLFRHVLIKTAVHTQEVLVIFITSSSDRKEIIPLAESLIEAIPEVKGVIQNIQPLSSNVILGKTFVTLAGKGFIEEKLHGLTFKVSPASFFQVNPLQAENLYSQVEDFADLQGGETVLDAYCGVGTLSLILARKAKLVLGVECVPEAIKDAIENSKRNNISNTSFICKETEVFIASLKAVDIVILNPPRKGCDPVVLKHLKFLKPKKIVYVSCDPATLARDLADLTQSGYTVKAVQPFDMFPQTSHVECVVLLTL